jgi:hypothetical protein
MVILLPSSGQAPASAGLS